jgi:hypothetical protein
MNYFYKMDKDEETNEKNNKDIDEEVDEELYEETDKKSNKVPIIIGVVFVVVLIVAAIITVVVYTSSSNITKDAKTVTTKYKELPATITEDIYKDYYNFYVSVKKANIEKTPIAIKESFDKITDIESFKVYATEHKQFLNHLHDFAKISANPDATAAAETPIMKEVPEIKETGPPEGTSDPLVQPIWGDINEFVKIIDTSTEDMTGMKVCLIYFAIYCNYGYGLTITSKEFKQMTALVKKYVNMDVYNCLLHFRQLIPLLHPTGAVATTIFFDDTTGGLTGSNFKKDRYDTIIENYVKLHVANHITVNAKNSTYPLKYAINEEYNYTTLHDTIIKPILDQIASGDLVYKKDGNDDDNKKFFTELSYTSGTFMKTTLGNPYFWKGFSNRAKKLHPKISHIPKAFPPINAQFELFQAIVACMNFMIRLNHTDKETKPKYISIDKNILEKYDEQFSDIEIVLHADIDSWIKLSEIDTTFNSTFGTGSELAPAPAATSESTPAPAATSESTPVAETFMNPYTFKIEYFENKFNVLLREPFRANALTQAFKTVQLSPTDIDIYENITNGLFDYEKLTATPFPLTAESLIDELSSVLEGVFKHKTVLLPYADIMTIYDFLTATTIASETFCFIIEQINSAIREKYGDWHFYLPIETIMNSMKIDTFMYEFMKSNPSEFPEGSLLKNTLDGFLSPDTNGESNDKTPVGNLFALTDVKNNYEKSGGKWWTQTDDNLQYINQYLYYQKQNDTTNLTKMKLPPYKLTIDFLGGDHSLEEKEGDIPQYAWPKWT